MLQDPTHCSSHIVNPRSNTPSSGHYCGMQQTSWEESFLLTLQSKLLATWVNPAIGWEPDHSHRFSRPSLSTASCSEQNPAMDVNLWSC